MAVILGAQDSTGGAGGAVAGVDSEVENNAHNSNAPTPPIDSDIPPPAVGSSTNPPSATPDTMGPPPQVVTNENQILVARHSAENDWFGGSVAISEDVMVIGDWYLDSENTTDIWWCLRVHFGEWRRDGTD